MNIASRARMSVLLTLFLHASHARAQELAPLGLADAVRTALGANRDLAATRQRIAPLRLKPEQVRSFAPPNLEAQAWQWPINTLAPANTGMFMLTASQDLSGRGKRAAMANLATEDLRTAEASLLVTERDIVAAVTQTYWDLALARRRVALRRASVDVVRRIADVAQLKYAAGQSSQRDVLQAVVEVTTLQNDVIDLDLREAQAALRLNALLNRPLETPIGTLDDPGEVALGTSLEAIRSLSTRAQPDVLASRALVSRAEAQETVARRAAVPEWTIGGGYMLQPRQTDAWTARISMTWPGAPWTRRAVAAQAAEARAAANAARAEVSAKETQAELAASDAYVRAKAAERQAALIRTTLLPQLQQAFESARIEYQVDRVELAAVIANERLLLNAQFDYFRALDDGRRALADLERTIGAPLPVTKLQLVSTGEVPR